MRKIFLAILISFFMVGSLYAADFGGIGGRPAHPTGEHPHDKEWFFFTLNPGESKEDAIEIQNNDEKENTIVFYPADSTPSTDGGFALKQKVEPREFVGKWIRFTQEQVTIPPHQSTVIPFTISIPNDPKIDVGEHTGAILMQKMNEAPTEAGGMQLLTRVGVRVYVTIPGDILKKLDITQFAVEPNLDKKIYTATLSVKNSGNVSQDIVMKTRVTNLYPWLSSIPFLKDLYKDFPLENARNLQVLRDDALTSNFEFKKPFFGKFKVEGWVEYDNGSKTLAAEPVIIDIGLDLNVLILLILIVAFLILLFALFILRKFQKKMKHLPSSSEVGLKKPSKKFPNKKISTQKGRGKSH